MSGEVYRVDSHLITASSSLNASHTPEEARLPGGEGWCSRMLGFSIHDPWLEVNFGTEVVVHGISVSGNNFSHINQFQLQYANGEDETLQYVLNTTEPLVSY